MSGIQPVAVYAMRIPPGDIMVPAVPEFAAMFRLTMAAIDPTAEPEIEDPDSKKPPRATLKVIRVPDGMIDDDEDSEDDEDFLDDEDDEEEDSEDDDAELNGGPSKLKVNGAEDDDEDMDDEDEDEDEIDEKTIARLTKLIKSSKGKSKAEDGEDEEELDDDSDLSDESLEMDEVVLCTLDPERHYQQPLDFVVNEGEKVFFKVSGTHWVHLTGNYVLPPDDGRASLYSDEDSEEEEEYDLEPTEEELAEMELMDEEDESDDLDDLAEPRLTEITSEDEVVPKLVKASDGKGKNKRPADDSEDDSHANLDDIIAGTLKNKTAVKAEPNEARKLTKAEKKKQKKLKANDGQAVDAPATSTSTKTETKSTAKATATPDSKPNTLSNGTSTSGSDKKVQFAKNLEQGPTPSANPPGSASKTDLKSKPSVPATTTASTTATSAATTIKDVQGVTVDERKPGSGATAKKNSRLEMRYIGKLESGKVFDSNKSGKPFTFKLGAGEVIKGWDLGLQGIQPGGERRLTIPPHLAYGKQELPGIPKNSKLIFDIKCLSVS